MRSFTIAATAATTLASLANSLAIRDNSTTSGNTPGSVKLFLDDAIDGQGLYAASIASVCKDYTVYAIQCTSAREDWIGSNTCGPDAETLTMTQAPSVFILTTATATSLLGTQAAMSVGASCDLTGTTEATCAYTYSISVEGTSTVISTTTALSGTDVRYYQVSITGGAEKTRAASATEACKPGGNGDGGAQDDGAGNAAAGIGPNTVMVTAAALAVGLLGVIAL